MNEFIVHPSARKPSHDAVVRGVLGIGIDQLIRDIRENKGGKYDALYIKKRQIKEASAR